MLGNTGSLVLRVNSEMAQALVLIAFQWLLHHPDLHFPMFRAVCTVDAIEIVFTCKEFDARGKT